MKAQREICQDGLVRHLMAKWGVTRSRVHQIEQNALRKIRNAVLCDPELQALAAEICGKPIEGHVQSLETFFNRRESQKKQKRKQALRKRRQKEAAA